MNKRLIPLALLFSTSVFSQVIRDTLYFDTYGYKAEPKTAATYKVLTSEKGNKTLNINEYNALANVLQSKGKGYKDDNGTLVYEGEVQYYSPQGKEEATYIYENGQISKILSENAFTSEKYEGKFKNGSLYNGTAFQRWKDSYFLLEAIDGYFAKYQIIDSKNQNHKITYQFDTDNNLEKESYYGKNGELVSEAFYSENIAKNGTVTNINSDTFTILSTAVYKGGKAISGKEFYQNGNLKSEYEIKNNIHTKTFYSKDNQVIGKYSAALDERGDMLSQNGTLISFNTYGDNPDLIYSTYTFQNDITVKSVNYYLDELNNPKEVYYYKNGYNDKTEFFNTNGSLKGELTYDESGYYPLNGTLFEDLSTTIYKDGEIVEKTTLHDNGTMFEKTDKLQSVYYDNQGKEIGKLTYKKDEYSGYNSPYNGSLFYSDGANISTQYKYENGTVSYMATYNQYEGKTVLKEENFYKNNNASKNVYYYPNGAKQKEEVFDTNTYSYQPDLITYYNKEGKVLGTYYPDKNEGTKYDFFTDEQIKLIEKYTNGSITYKKQYDTTDTSWWNETNKDIPVYLFCEIDYSKEGKFYSADGNLISTVIYKDGQPYSGKVLDRDSASYTLIETEYKEGKKDGIEILKYTYNNEIVSKTYYANGEKVKEEAFNNGIIQNSVPYQNDLAEGKAVFYDSEGKEISTLIYREGLPYEGTYNYQSGYEYSVKEQYSDGNLILKQIYSNEDNLIAEDKNIETNKIIRSIFDTNSNLVLVYEKNSDNLLDGKYEYYENGKIKYKATLNEGILVNGTIAIQDLDYAYNYGNSENHTVISYNKGKLKLEVLNNITNKVEFSMDSKIKQNNKELNPILSKKIDINNLYPYSEFNSEYSYYY